ncbi:P-loop containing nucleoside triphosphate hydrolase [Kalmanozyma brasiliensis GHG001]|uniref:P-loop containing nucleoside triphosphate hydrolase n=1 Tax=Kalmanozyma brasiliensis (strain GHG001) TaxID=1365824 RepID=UPI002867EC0D|nr:P-loop containing nucleoside triphosphate hydrolase [Kalmanozyma brasiliensis GHG001]KAF6767184.1 P-loop containing nucleoside triphosphate hydrolase [Kalmanozyma brasiliensis GHG001]
MQGQVAALVQELLAKVQTLDPSERLLVGVSGIPGSGKSSLAVRLVSDLNATQPSLAICVGMDGWHYPRSTLSTFPNPQEAFDRRGAEWTFDAKRFADFVLLVKSNTSKTHTAPSFDHAKKDPLENDVAVLPEHRVVVFEGLYCNCEEGEWARAARGFDRRLVFEMDKDEARRRLVVRHVKTGVAKDEEEAMWRADNNDLPNGDWLMSHLLEPYTVVRSIADPSWR